jgi:hypothetical protein
MKKIVKKKTRINVCNSATRMARSLLFAEGDGPSRHSEKWLRQIADARDPHGYWRFAVSKTDDAISG